mmetsp:Transcript_1349/g.3117  ORF Transcript_1349/g.3117 Transcript_1349/m.3117 type:complete len:322 (+) Transcript_1349:146-1111(+)
MGTYLFDGDGLLLAPPHDVSSKSDNAGSKDEPSEDLSSAGSLGEHLGNDFTSSDVLSVVRVVFHTFFALEGRFFVGLLADFLDLGFTVIVVVGTAGAAGGDKSSLRVRKSPSVGDGGELDLAGLGAVHVSEEFKLDVHAIIGAGRSDVEGVVLPGTLGGIIGVVVRVVLLALGELVHVPSVLVFFLFILVLLFLEVLHVGLNEGGDSNKDVTVSAGASHVTRGVASSGARAQSEKDSGVLVLTLFVDDRRGQITLAANHLDAVVSKEGEFLFFLFFFLGLFLFDTTAGADQLASGVGGDASSRGASDGGESDKSGGDLHVC